MGEPVDEGLPVKDVRSNRGGRCRRGRGSHSGRSDTIWAPLPSGFCYFYANGLHCKFGADCGFKHEIPGTVPAASNGGHVKVRFHQGAYRGRGAGKAGPKKTTALNPDAPAFVPASDDVSHLPAQVEPEEPPETKGKPRRRQPKKRTGGGYLVRERKADSNDEDGERKEEKEPKPYVPYNRRAPAANPRHRLRLKRSVVTDETLRELREGEVAYLQRRYPKMEETEDGQFIVAFVPTDPDWPFDVRSLRLSISFPPEYPLNPFTAKMAGAGEGEQEPLPELLALQLDKAMAARLAETKELQESRGIVEPALRNFLLWLDRSAERLFIQGLKAVRMDMQARQSGISFVHLAPKGDEPPSQEVKDLNLDAEAEEEEEEEVGEEEEDTSESEEESSLAEEEVGESKSGAFVDLRPGECELRLKAEWSASVGALSLRRLAMLLTCARCHAKKEAPVLGGLKTSTAFSDACDKCGLVWSGEARSLLAHDGSAALGAVKIEGASPLDVNLLASELLLLCLGCNAEVAAKGLAYGSLHRTWCNACNRKLELRVDSLRFHHRLPVDLAALASAAPTKKERKPAKDGRIKEGLPLPDNGACRHYRKSFRWFRFPCCGKIYPCDLCHEEAESHEMKLANRILCGFCAKEQPYAGTKGCIACGGAVVAAKTTHWEGGRGCRNTRVMSTNDKQKYAGLAKTTSNRKERLEAAAKKKKTKAKAES